MSKSRFTEEQIIGFIKQAEAGLPIKELCRKGGFSDATFYKSRAYIESFNGKFRDECLNEQWLQDLHQATIAIKECRQDYNEVRPHSSCGRVPLAKFAELHRQHAGDATRTPSTTGIN